jgi:hypothetical protein
MSPGTRTTAGDVLRSQRARHDGWRIAAWSPCLRRIMDGDGDQDVLFGILLPIDKIAWCENDG